MTAQVPWVEFLCLTLVAQITISLADIPSRPQNDIRYCRDRLGFFKTDDFKVSTCAMCYVYLVLQTPLFSLNKSPEFRIIHESSYFLVSQTDDLQGSIERIYPNIENTTSIDTVCETLDDEICSNWLTCCEAAWSCCQHQHDMISETNDSVYNISDGGFVDGVGVNLDKKRNRDGDGEDNSVRRFCPQTFDGWSCWDSAPANTTVTMPCPTFLAKDSLGLLSRKTCRGDGNWAINAETGLEYTDYEQCIANTQLKVQRHAIILSISLNVIGCILIIPAIVMFTKSRVLRKQQRIKIHVNLFLSILLTSTLNIVWDVGVRLDRLSHTEHQSFLHRQQVLCKLIYVMHQYLRATTFFWMSCEGYFLHRLMVNAFLPAKHFHGYMLYGWGLPLLLFSLYGGVRKFIADDRMCWILPLDGSARALEWLLVFIPILGCLLANMVFFGNILKLMLTRLVVHPEEPSKFRRAIRATSLLIPLFGLHLFCFMYRPKVTDGTGYDVYEIFSAIVLNSQGILVSVLLFYCNGEIQSHVKSAITRWRKKHVGWQLGYSRKMSAQSLTGSTSRRTSVTSSHTVGLPDIVTSGDTHVTNVTQTTKF